MKIELHCLEYPTPEVIDRVLNYHFNDDFTLLFLYDVRETKGVDPLAVVNLHHWAMVKFCEED